MLFMVLLLILSETTAIMIIIIIIIIIRRRRRRRRSRKKIKRRKIKEIIKNIKKRIDTKVTFHTTTTIQHKKKPINHSPEQMTICERGEVYEGRFMDLIPRLNILEMRLVLVKIAE